MFVCEYDRPDFAAGILMAKHYAARVGVRVLPTFDAWSPTNPAKTLAKHAIFRLVDGAKVSGPEAAELAARYGLPRERTFRVRQTVDVSHYSSAVAMKDSERQHRRMSMGLFGCTFIYAGRLWRGKGLDTLFAAYEALLRDGLNVSLLLIGNGADEAYYRQRAANMARVIFAGFHQVEEMPSLYRLGDVLVFPTLGDPHGLVVEEGMASGLPVISSMSAGHITERIIPGSNGFLFATGDTGELGDRMRRLALDANLRASLSDGARATVRLMGHEMYADDFEAFVTQIMALPRRRPW